MSIRELIDQQNSALIFIDHQPQMSFGVANIDRQLLKNNTVALAKAGKIFDVPVIYTSVETKSFSGYIWPELLAVHPDVKPIERTSMNSWEDDAFVAAVKATGRKKLIISALWTEVCLTFPALMALDAFAGEWDDKYPQISKSWRAHWENLNTFFGYPPDIRKAIYTTNAIESLNSVIRAAIKKRKVFPTDDSVRKVVYLAIKDASKKWSMPIQNWRLAMSRFIIEFGDRLSDHL